MEKKYKNTLKQDMFLEMVQNVIEVHEMWRKYDFEVHSSAGVPFQSYTHLLSVKEGGRFQNVWVTNVILLIVRIFITCKPPCIRR